MLLTRAELHAIKAGTQARVYRRWKWPCVKTGGTLKTSIGLLAIDRVIPVALEQISARDAKQAGHASLPDLLAALETVARHPHVAAAELSRITGYEKECLKLNVRKLKNLGLTISHEPGYELSPRGKALLRHLKR